MPKKDSSTEARLDGLWRDPEVPERTLHDPKLVLLSDLHLGDGKSADNFFRNTEALCRALDHYHQEGFSLILLGDIEDLWQFDLDEIQTQYADTVYAAMRQFPDDRFIRIFGNHDDDWAPKNDPARHDSNSNPIASEAVRLKTPDGQPRFLLVHGHQGSPDADRFPWLSRFFVRLFRFVERFARLLGVYKIGPALAMQVTQEYERIFYQWAKRNRVIVICGHSHRAIFAAKSYFERLKNRIAELKRSFKETPGDPKLTEELSAKREAFRIEKKRKRKVSALDPSGDSLPCYFNTGCGIYDDGITALEMEGNFIRLVKWHRNLSPKQEPREVFQEGEWGVFAEEVGKAG
jgi:UDP-2,3-diacylglucosamine pyrophosphatase LpxH